MLYSLTCYLTHISIIIAKRFAKLKKFMCLKLYTYKWYKFD